MKLYHGTSLKAANRMIREGIKPRWSGGTDNWKHTVTSNPNCVYLTCAYPLHFMWNACKGKTRFGAVVEIETDRLDMLKLLPDEDTLAQVDQHTNKDTPMVTGTSLYEKTAWYRDHLTQWSDGQSWIKSLDTMGTCCHYGVVPPTAITRIAVIDLNKNRHLILQYDPTISILNYSVMEPFYRASSQALFGDEPSDELKAELHDELHKNWRPEIKDLKVRDIDAEYRKLLRKIIPT